ncbi:D-arabinose 5-phosphate isomerase [Bacteroidia bacterium]|nr:D-arabinose 5-phosphate isomerase [Bacteroidia bacterium]GHT81468.1 D-arabinose 5-phosphate isomerase [Bacteroidia bacterium]
MDFSLFAKQVFDIEIAELQRVASVLGDEINAAVELIYRSKGKVVITGIGKAGIVGHKIASSLASTGTNAIFVNAAEAQHGDLGMVSRGDVVIAVSNSGTTQELLNILPVFKQLQCSLIAITGNVNSALAQAADVVLNAHVNSEACPLGLAPTSSTTAELVMGDALTVCLIERRGFKAENFALYHPGGALGRKLLTQVSNVMHTELPVVQQDTTFKDIIYEVSNRRLGMTLVNNAEGEVIGVITDGDIRRAIGKCDKEVMNITAADCMSSQYKSIAPDKMISDALALMEHHKIMTLVVQNPPSRKAVGIVSMHDIIEMRK